MRLAKTYKSKLAGEVGAPAVCLKNNYDEKDQLRQPSTPITEELNASAP